MPRFITPPMKRRLFLQSSVAAGLAGLAPLSQTVSAAAVAETKGREYYELRVFSMKVAKKPLLDDYLSKAFIPALHRLGLGPVGVFSESPVQDDVSVYVLIVYSSCDQFATLSARLAGDAEHQKAGADYLAAVAADPVYARIESWLMGAIEGHAKLTKPDTSKPRLLNLRVYESHNERAAHTKIEMFNHHEMPIFERVGLTPVFFGETIIGPRMPNLTYMLVFPDDAGRKAAWDRFRVDEDWKKLKAEPQYADKEIVSKITNKILTPEAYSEI